MEFKLHTEEELTRLKDKGLIGLVRRENLPNEHAREFESHSNTAMSGAVLFGGERRQIIGWILDQQKLQT